MDVYLIYNFLKDFPKELEEAAVIERVSLFSILINIITQSIKPIVMTLGFITFLGIYNDYLWPSLIATSNEMRTITVGISSLVIGSNFANPVMMMAATVFSVLPALIIFLFVNKYVVNGITNVFLGGRDYNMETTTKKIRLLKLQEIHMRDPYIFADTADKTYYLYGTTSVCNGAADIDPYFEIWRSKDLVHFEGPYAAFRPKKGFWGVKDYWAPEVHEYKGKYYMFASFKGGIGENRGTAILKADSPAGPFYEWSKGPVTLRGHECLDGTLYVDESGKPWVVFCLEWTSAYFGKILALPLTDDLRSSENQNPVFIVDTETDGLPWIRHMSDARVEKIGYLTDAPFLHRNPDGSLLLLWSSYSISKWGGTGQGGYVVARCISRSGSINGPWSHDFNLLLDENAGHCSIFKDFNGELRLVCHCNDTEHGSEYPVIYKLIQNDDNISILRHERNDC